MARLLTSEIYAEITAQLCGLRHLDKEKSIKHSSTSVKPNTCRYFYAASLTILILKRFSVQILSKRLIAFSMSLMLLKGIVYASNTAKVVLL